MSNVQITGIEEFKGSEKDNIEKICDSSYQKIKRFLKGEFKVSLFIKTYKYSEDDKSDKAKKYSLHCEIKLSSKKFDSESSGWDLNKCLHEVFNKLISEIEHTFHVSEQGRE